MEVNVSYLVILAILFGIVIWISITTDMLRNVVFDQNSFNALATSPSAKPGFSLAKTQLAFWTVIVTGSFIYVLFFLPNSHGMKTPIVIDAVNLTLLGIAAGTTVVGKAIDGSQQNSPAASTVGAQQNQPAKGFFFLDIISDETGVSVHRLQNVLWTLIVGVIYIVYVSNQKEMPTDKVITPVLLGLMGISSAAYLGVKTTENTAPAAPVISYSPAPPFVAGATMTFTPANTGGTAGSYAIAPALPATLTLNTTTGVITGTLPNPLPGTVYTITATNATGSGTAKITI